MANTYLTWTPSATPTGSAKKFTFSAWVKFNSENPGLIMVAGSSSSSYCIFGAYSGGKITLLTYTGYVINFSTSRLFKDLNCWYHVVLACDTTQASATSGVKLYVNGELQTFNLGSVSGQSGYTQNTSLRYGTNGEVITIGANSLTSQQYFNGIMSYVAFVDGQQLTPSTFGETDATTGEWKIKTSITPGGTGWGTNGFFILKDGNSVTDQSGNSNNFTVGGGNLTKTEDSPSNVFCTLNPLIRFSSNPTLSTGNLSIDENGATWQSSASTLGVSQGKWYYEYKAETAGGSGLLHKLGFMSEQLISAVGHMADTTVDGGYGWYTNDNGELRTDSAVISGWSASDITNITSITTGDVLKIAIDMDNKFAYFGVNNVWAKNGDPTSGSSGTGGLDISADYPSGKILIPAVSVYNGCTGSINFGNGYFGTTAVSSAGTNASGIGIFEYDVPTGYTALSTKGLNL